MKVAMILAAGRGERMRPLTDSLPKPLLKVRSKPLIHHHLYALQKAGYQHVVINHAWLGQQLVDALQDDDQFNLNIHFSEEQHALETAGGIVNALPMIIRCLAGDVSFTVINGDIFTNIDFATLPEIARGDLAHLVLVNNPEHNQNGDFCLRQGRVSHQQKNQFTFSGVAVYHVDFFAKLTVGKRSLAPLLFQYAAQQKVSGEVHNGYWFDVGTPQRLTEINLMESE
jgi:MurNAc alpha-1-phosphate uridylyltransferase